MFSSDAIFEASSVYFQYVNEQAAHVKEDCFPSVSTWAAVNLLISLAVGWLSTTGVL